jgi:hypothetical protein
MTKRKQPSIDPELIGALRTDAADGPGSVVQARVLARIENRIATLAAPVSGTALTASAASSPTDLPLPDVVSPSAPSLLVSALTKPVSIAVIGAALGGAGSYALTEPAKPVVIPEHHVPSAHVAGVPATANTRRASSAAPNNGGAPPVESHTELRRQVPVFPRKAAPRSHKQPFASSAPERNTTAHLAVGLGEQQALLDTARKALARGENQAVLKALSEHSDRYPQSDLVEEREALAIKALVAAGQYDAARERGARFEQRFPGSLLIPAVTTALRTIP